MRELAAHGDLILAALERQGQMAELIALEAGRSGLRVVTVNPTTPIGEQDVKPTPTGRIVVDFLSIGQIEQKRGAKAAAE